MKPDVIVVLEPKFGERIDSLLSRAPIWIVVSEFNRPIYQRLWQTNKHEDHREIGAITAFQAKNPEDRNETILNIMSDVETHHGTAQGNYLLFPPGFGIEVIGIKFTEDLGNELKKEYGFSSFIEIPEGFQAIKQ
jgi:hypothetical protein